MICALDALKSFVRLGLFNSNLGEHAVAISQVVYGVIWWVYVAVILCISEIVIIFVYSCKFVSTDLALDSRCYFECVQTLGMIISDLPNAEHHEWFGDIIQYLLAVVDGSKGEFFLCLLNLFHFYWWIYIVSAIEHVSSIPIVIAAQEVLNLAAQKVSFFISSTVASDLWLPIHDCWLRWIRYCLLVLQTRRKRVWFDECSKDSPLKMFTHEQPTNYQCSNVVASLKMMKLLVVDIIGSPSVAGLLRRSVLMDLLLREIC
jgi:hypothetical protein